MFWVMGFGRGRSLLSSGWVAGNFLGARRSSSHMHTFISNRPQCPVDKGHTPAVPANSRAAAAVLRWQRPQQPTHTRCLDYIPPNSHSISSVNDQLSECGLLVRRLAQCLDSRSGGRFVRWQTPRLPAGAPPVDAPGEEWSGRCAHPSRISTVRFLSCRRSDKGFQPTRLPSSLPAQQCQEPLGSAQLCPPESDQHPDIASGRPSLSTADPHEQRAGNSHADARSHSAAAPGSLLLGRQVRPARGAVCGGWRAPRRVCRSRTPRFTPVLPSPAAGSCWGRAAWARTARLRALPTGGPAAPTSCKTVPTPTPPARQPPAARSRRQVGRAGGAGGGVAVGRCSGQRPNRGPL